MPLLHIQYNIRLFFLINFQIKLTILIFDNVIFAIDFHFISMHSKSDFIAILKSSKYYFMSISTYALVPHHWPIISMVNIICPNEILKCVPLKCALIQCLSLDQPISPLRIISNLAKWNISEFSFLNKKNQIFYFSVVNF